MPDFLPFAGIRYDVTRLPADGEADIGAVAAPPYDVIDEERRAALEAAHPHNSVRLILPRDDAGRDRYAVAADTASSWLAEGVLLSDGSPRFYLYRMDFRDEDGRARHTRGVIGVLALPSRPYSPVDGRPASGTVLPHEHTMARTKSDRLALLRATRANLDPIWCLSLAARLSGMLAADGPELARCVDDDGVQHRLLALEGNAAVRVAGAIAAAPIVIADGHHRFETACAYRDELAAAGRDDPAAGGIMALVVELTEDELCVRAIHRVLTGLGGSDLRVELGRAFEVREAGPNNPEGVDTLRARMREQGALGLVDGAGLALLVPRPEVLEPRLAGFEAPVRHVGATLFESGVRPSVPGAVVGYRSDATAVAALVDKGAAEAAVLLQPVSVAQIREAAFAGARMPEKTTYFHPKPRTGMVFRSLDG